MSLIHQIQSKKFYTNGYLEAGHLLSDTAIASLVDYCMKESGDHPSGFFSSIWIEDASKRKRDFEIIRQYVWNEISSHFEGYELIMANFMIKKNKPESTLGLHQDWTFTDESKNNSINIWIPLSDINEDNGPLSFILGSHRIDNPIRGKNIMQVFEDGIPKILKKYTKSFLVKKGNALIFDTRMIHFSPPNLSNQVRWAISMVIVPKGTPLIHYYKEIKDSKEIKKINIDPTYFYNYHLSTLPLDIEVSETIVDKTRLRWKRIHSIFQIITHHILSR